MSIVTELNSLVTTLNHVDPAWYVILVGPLANIVQHFLKKEHDFAKDHGLLVSIILAAGSGAFLAVMKSSNLSQFLSNTALIGSPIYLVANLLYQGVSSKIEQLNANQPVAEVAPVVMAPVVTATPAVEKI